MASITEHLIKLQELTQKNLDILQALNDSFFTNKDHLSVMVGEEQFAIPSFISLENKINSLTANFENLVNAPETGEAFFNFDGNSRAIEVRSYTSVPNSIVLNPISSFKIEQNDIFKDFLTPNPYIHFNIPSLPNDITQVLVKKIIPQSQELKDLFKSLLIGMDGDKIVNQSSVQQTYSDIYKIISLYTQDVDYIEYDTRIDLPIRKNIGSGLYVIEEIVEDIIDENLDNYITLKFRSDVNHPSVISSLKYRLFDETIEKMLKVGDQLVTFEGNAKMEIVELYPNTNTVKIKVLHGEFLNLVESSTNNFLAISDLSKIKFFSPINFDEDKYIKIPLEEDQYIFVAIAALNSRMNVQSPWGSGLVINSHILTNENVNFKTYYDENVRNVGDVLFEITSLMSNTLTKYTASEFNEFTNFTPEINTNNLLVTQINKHLNDSVTVKNIRALYSQKKNIQTQLSEVQNEINSLNEVLSGISFDDTTGRRTAYTAQISSLNVRKNELNTSITKIIDEIAVSANNSEVPIENAKYRIRGFFDISNNKWIEHIKGIRVQYRYKNIDSVQNHTLTINDKFTFSDWNEMESTDRVRIPRFENGIYKSSISDLNDNANEPSFNQIDIPISQGETVDIRLKLVYDFGDPFVQTSSNWSPIVNIEFPDEYLKDVKILDIIEENNNDIESNRFSNIIKEEGIPEHVNDKIVDQDSIYYHKPENIASGFYTAERRIIPLKDKLEDLNNIMVQLKDEVYGSNADSLKVSIKHGISTTILNPFIDNKIYTEAYSTVTSTDYQNEGNYEVDATSKMVTTVLNISLLNDSDHIVKLYSMFPGDRDTILNRLVNSRKFEKNDFCHTTEETQTTPIKYQGVWIEHPLVSAGHNCCDGCTCSDTNVSLQGGNQYLYFRIKNVNTGEDYYGPENQSLAGGENGDLLSYDKDFYKYPDNSTTVETLTKMYVYPKLSSRYGLCLDSNIVGSHMIIKPHEEIIIPVVVEYCIGNGEGQFNEIQKHMAFDIFPSLYKDPISYNFTIIAKKENSAQDKIIANQQNNINAGGTKYNIIFK